MRVIAFVDEIQIPIEKQGPQVGIVSGIVAGVDHGRGIISCLKRRRDPIVKNTERGQKEKNKIKTSTQNQETFFEHAVALYLNHQAFIHQFLMRIFYSGDGFLFPPPGHQILQSFFQTDLRTVSERLDF